MTSAAAPRQRPRTCVACREESPKRALIRIVRSPDGSVVLDERGKLPGRGAYLCARVECLDKAQKSKALARALKTDIADELYDRLREHLRTYGEERSAGEVKKELRLLLGLARRAGLLQIGTDSVKSQCTKEPLLILTAADSSASVNEIACKLTCASGNGGRGHRHIAVPLSVEEISGALGAANVQVIALPVRNGLADKIMMLLQEGGVALEQNESV